MRGSKENPPAGQPGEQDAEREQARNASSDEILKRGKRPRTVGEAIDRLGVTSPHDAGDVHQRAVKGVVFLVSESDRTPGLMQVTSHVAGSVSPMEVLGLLEFIKRDLLSERNQDAALRQFLTQPQTLP